MLNDDSSLFKVHIWRRSFDVPPPGGESLKLTADRVLPYYEKEIKPEVLKGKKVLVTAHGNSLRAMIMNLENMTGEQIVNTGAICSFFPSGGFSADHHSHYRAGHWRSDCVQNRRERQGRREEDPRVD